MTDTGHIFLSYRSIEADFALKLAADLKNAGVRLWMDRLDGIQVGMDWRDAIQGAINACAAMIAVLSPDYVESEYCKKELARANTLQRPIFPVLLRPVQKEDWPLVIESVQYEDFSDWLQEDDYTKHFDNLLSRLKTEIKSPLGDTPDAEEKYLVSLIAELESRRGVLEYVELGAEVDAPDIRPQPPIEDEWGFTELIVSQSSTDHQAKTVPQNIADVAKKHDRFVLLGEPGVGKTTTLRRLVCDAARKRLENPRLTPLPLLLYLSQWAEELTPSDFIARRWVFSSDPMKLLKAGEITLYLDGLNEMGIPGPEKAKLLREWLQSDNAPRKVIVTCRTEDYETALNLGRIPVIVAQELDEYQVRQFAQSYLGERSDSFINKILSSADETNHSTFALINLARNPYMLSALLFLFEKSPEGNLPTNTGILLSRLVRALWKREEQRRTFQNITFDQVQKGFATLAFSMINEEMPTEVSIEYAIRQLDNELMLNTGSRSSLISIGQETVRFYHQLMQEYFAAVELLNIPLSDILSSAKYRWIRRRATKWDRVIVAASGLVDNADLFVSQVLEYSPHLASDCIATGTVVSDDVKANVVTQLLRADSWSAIDKIAQIASPKIILMLNDALNDEFSRVRRVATEVLGRLKPLDAVPVLRSALEDEDGLVRQAAIYALGEIGNEIVIEDLTHLLSDNNRQIRQSVLNALQKIGTPKALAAIETWRQTQNQEK